MKQRLSDSVLAQTFRAAMQIWDQQKAAGIPVLERLKGLEKTLRSAWPMTREWKYLCWNCMDYGLEIHDCPGDSTCGREKAHLPHDFGKPCWCSAGAKFRPKPVRELDHTDAGAMPKRKPTRIGR
jgi:hypothetical protein